MDLGDRRELQLSGIDGNSIRDRLLEIHYEYPQLSGDEISSQAARLPRLGIEDGAVVRASQSRLQDLCRYPVGGGTSCLVSTIL